MEDELENGYTLKSFARKFILPQVVRVVSGIYDMLDEISLSREEILTLHSLKKYEAVKATTKDEENTFYLPLNVTSKVAIVSTEMTESDRKTYEDVETLADDFPPLVASIDSHGCLDIDEGDILKPIQTWITNPRQGYLQCAILNKPLNDDVFIPLSYTAKFKTLEDTNYNSLFLKEVVTNYQLPIQIRFLEDRVVIRKHDINSGRPTSMEKLGVITLHGQHDISLVVATTTDQETGKVHSLLNLPQDLDITIVPFPGSPKRHKKNNRLLELDFCDKNFVYGSTIIEERQDDDPDSEDVLPRLFPRKRTGAPSRFKHKDPIDKSKTMLLSNSCDGNGEHAHQCDNCHGDGDSCHGDGDSCHGDGDSCHGDGCYGDGGSEQVDSAFPVKQKSLSNGTKTNTSDDALDGKSHENVSEKMQNSAEKNTIEANKDGYLDMNDTVDIVKELAKFKASIKYHYRTNPSKTSTNSPYKDNDSNDDIDEAKCPYRTQQSQTTTSYNDDDEDNGDGDECACGLTTDKLITDDQYQSLNTSTMMSRETRLNTLKKLKEECFSLETVHSRDVGNTSSHRHRSDLAGYTIPVRSKSLSDGRETPLSLMRPRTLTGSFLHNEEENDEESSRLHAIGGQQSSNVHVNFPDEYKKYIYRRPPPLPPQYNTLPASLSKKSKSKSSRKGSLKKLAIFTKKNLKRSQSVTDKTDDYDYTYVETVSSSTVDKKTDIGKMWDMRKAFEKRDNEQSYEELPLNEGSRDDGPRDRIRTLDVNEVSKLLQTLSLHRYVDSFKDAKIDGSMLVELTDKMLIELDVNKELDRHKIRKAVQEGWVPKEES